MRGFYGVTPCPAMEWVTVIFMSQTATSSDAMAIPVSNAAHAANRAKATAPRSTRALVPGILELFSSNRLPFVANSTKAGKLH